MKKSIFISLFLLVFCSGVSISESIAQDSSRLRISLLTCTPGEELYSIFGHSAIRIIDSNSVTDHVFNYGTFNFNDEGFYLKFIRGKLLYYISLEEFSDFKFIYQAEGRGMTEQLLNFTPEEKKAIHRALIENLREENKYYKYDFFLDNCTTRLRDIILQYKNPHPVLPAVMPSNTRFRQAIHEYLDKGKQYWSKLGIDILLGAPTDQVMTASQQQFLPDNLMRALDGSSNVQVVSSSNNLYELPVKDEQDNWFTPMFFFSFFLGTAVLMSLSKNSNIQFILNGFDGFIFFMTGLLGVILVLMWTSTDHSMTKNNYNLLWAWPTHMLAAFFINSSRSFAKKYFLFSAIILSMVLVSWFFLPQQMNNALIPFVLLLIYRSAMRYFRQS